MYVPVGRFVPLRFLGQDDSTVGPQVAQLPGIDALVRAAGGRIRPGGLDLRRRHQLGERQVVRLEVFRQGSILLIQVPS